MNPRWLGRTLLLFVLLSPVIVLAQERQPCFNPFPNINPDRPGACFIDPLGIFLQLDEGDEFVGVETFGGADAFIKIQPNRRVQTHEGEIHASIYYCPPGVDGLDCSSFFFPGPDAWLGTGKFHVSTELNEVFIDNIFVQVFTCPGTILGHGTVTDPDGDEHALTVKMISAKLPNGGCRDVIRDISVTP